MPGLRTCAQRRGCCSRVMSLSATARSIPGTLRQEVVIDGQHRLITDEPEHLGGDERAGATRAVPRSARRLRLDDARDVCANERMGARRGRRRGRLRPPFVTAQIPDRDSAQRRPQRRTAGASERVAQACPLRRSIEAGIEFVEDIRAPRLRNRTRAGGDRRCIVSRKQIVIVGGGTAGTMTANRLRRRFDTDEAEIHVVDRDDRHVYQPGLLRPFGLARRGDRAAAPAAASERDCLPRDRGRRGVVERDEVLLDDGTVLPTTCSSLPAAYGCNPRRPKA